MPIFFKNYFLGQDTELLEYNLQAIITTMPFFQLRLYILYHD